MDISHSIHGLKVIRMDDLRQAFIQFHTSQSCDVILRIMTDEEKEVRMLLNETLAEGSHSVAFSFGSLSGNYHVRLVVNTHNAIDIETQQIKIV